MASPPFKVKALFEYTSNHEDDLPFEVGQIITVTNDEDPDWYDGEYVDASGEKQEGIFPRNFVEKYEPTAPPRPTRPRKKEPEHAPPPPAPVGEAAEPDSEPESVQEVPVPASPPPPEEPRSPRAPAPPAPKPAEPVPVASPQVVPPSESISQPPSRAPAPARSGPPPVSQKPTASSFKDRIAAFNKPAAPPIAPFKPSGYSSGNSGFIKKPFVAPPPSRNAYVPPARDTPTARIYRRDEDPEVKQREAENLEIAEKAGLVPSASQQVQGEDQPKPTTLKERIALLQKQQAEQAQRHADAVAKKEKPKRPPKKRTESDDQHENVAVEDTEAPPPLERRGTEPTEQPLPTRRKSYKETPDDGNEADMSGAGDTTEEQEDLTEREESDERPKRLSRAPTGAEQAEAQQGEDEAVEKEEEEEEEEEEEDVDPEVRRKEELRARMAKMSGGMGMMGLNMFGAPLPAAAPKKKKKAPERRASGYEDEPSSPRVAAQPIAAMMALPGMGQRKPKEEEEAAEAEEPESPTAEEITPVSTASPRAPAPEARSRAPGSPPPIPGGRPAPPPVPAQSRPPPPPPPATADVASPSVGSESDDELSENPLKSPETPRGEPASASRAAPPPIPTSPRLPSSKRTSYIAEDHTPSSPSVSSPQTKRYSRPPPPIPGVAPPAPTESRPPPPPPPGTAPGRTSTSDDRLTSPMRPGQLDNGEEGEVTEYEGDYDTDIASSVPHKEALKSHGRESSLEEDSAPVRSPISDAPPPSFPPPIPTAAAPMAVRPPIPSQPAPPSRRSTDMPRAAPPPPPPPKEQPYLPEDEEYDPYNYATPHAAVPTAMSYSVTRHEEPEPYDEPEPEPAYQSQPMPAPPPPPDHREPPPAPPATKAPARQSVEGPRPSIGLRRSVDVGRPSVSMETGFMANDIDLAEHTNWWTQPNPLPPALQGRKDIFSEVAESASQEGGKNVIIKEIYILFTDYSQTVITVRFDPQRPLDTQLEQRHEPPPRSLRQDELEQAYERFGTQIAGTVSSKKDSVVGDGSPHSLVHELLKPHKDALFPVGTRAYGALVYANLANASTTMNDEIRAGDIISIRNAKFQGKHGPMHAKYTMEVGKPDHVGVVSEWDGTKKKVRAWEQGRESKKVKQESFKLDDLRSGEIKIWRVMPRSWVGWDPSNH